MMKFLPFILVLITFSCSSPEPEKIIKEKTKKECNYLYPKFVSIDNKTILPFGKDTLYELQFDLNENDTTICYKILTTDARIYNRLNVCDQMLVTINKEEEKNN